MALVVACAVVWRPVLGADAGGGVTAGLGARVGQVEVQQHAIQGQTARTADELDAIIAEFDESGMGQQADVQTLKAIRAVLTRLSDQDMEKVIALLRAARTDANAQRSRNTALDAFHGQKAIIVQLRQLMLDYQRQQTLLDLALHFAALAQRENTDLHAVGHMLRDQQFGRCNPWDEAGRVQLRMQQVEQAALHDETSNLLQRLRALAGTVDAATPDGKRMAAALELPRTVALDRIFAQTLTELGNTNLPAAARRLETLRDALRQLARLVAPPREPVEILEAAAQQLALQIGGQTHLIAGTSALPAEGQREKGADLEDQQADVVDTVELVRQDVADLAADAADQLAGALGQLREARANLLQGHRDPAVHAQKAANDRLQAARQAILARLAQLAQEELAKDPAKNNADAAEQAAADKAAADRARQLKTAVETLRKDQEALNAQTLATGPTARTQPLAAQQAALTDRARQLLAKAAAQTPEVAPQIQQAAGDMQVAKDALAADQANAAAQPDAGKPAAPPNAPTAAPVAASGPQQNKDAPAGPHDQAAQAQHEAVEALNQATEKLDAQIAAAQAGALGTLQQAAQRLDQLLGEELAIQKQTADLRPAPAAAPNPPQGGDKADAKDKAAAPAKAEAQSHAAQGDKAQTPADAAAGAAAQKVAERQQANAEAAAEAKSDIEAAAPEAAGALDTAQTDMETASAQLHQGDAANAQGAEQGAVWALAAAKAQVARQLDAEQAEQASMNKALSDANEEDAAPQLVAGQQQASSHKQSAARQPGPANAPVHEGSESSKADGSLQPGNGVAQSRTPSRGQNDAPWNKGLGQRDDAKIQAGGAVDAAHGARGGSTFLNLPARDRQAIEQSRHEKYPEEYGAMIEQFYKNISDQESAK